MRSRILFRVSQRLFSSSKQYTKLPLLWDKRLVLQPMSSRLCASCESASLWKFKPLTQLCSDQINDLPRLSHWLILGLKRLYKTVGLVIDSCKHYLGIEKHSRKNTIVTYYESAKLKLLKSSFAIMHVIRIAKLYSKCS